MTPNKGAWLRAALFALLATPVAALAAVQKNPITTEPPMRASPSMQGRQHSTVATGSRPTIWSAPWCRRIPATAIKTLEKLVGDFDRFGAEPNQRLNAKVLALTNAALIGMFSGSNDDAGRVLATRSSLMRENARVVGTEPFLRIQDAQIAFLNGQLAAWCDDLKAAAKFAQTGPGLMRSRATSC
jgi:hypothetical protein